MQFAFAGAGSLTKVNTSPVVPEGECLLIDIEMLTGTLDGLRIDAAGDPAAPLVPIINAATVNWADPEAVAAAGISFAYWAAGAGPLSNSGSIRLAVNTLQQRAFDVYLQGGTANVWIGGR